MKANTVGGLRLRAWIKDERRTQEWIAEQVGAHQTSVSRWLKGGEVPLAAALKLHEITGIEPEAWLAKTADESGEHAALKTGT